MVPLEEEHENASGNLKKRVALPQYKTALNGPIKKTGKRKNEAVKSPNGLLSEAANDRKKSWNWNSRRLLGKKDKALIVKTVRLDTLDPPEKRWHVFSFSKGNAA